MHAECTPSLLSVLSASKCQRAQGAIAIGWERMQARSAQGCTAQAHLHSYRRKGSAFAHGAGAGPTVPCLNLARKTHGRGSDADWSAAPRYAQVITRRSAVRNTGSGSALVRLLTALCTAESISDQGRCTEHTPTHPGPRRSRWTEDPLGQRARELTGLGPCPVTIREETLQRHALMGGGVPAATRIMPSSDDHHGGCPVSAVRRV